MVKFNPSDLMVLEIGSGIWFLLSFTLIILLLRHAVGECRRLRRGCFDPSVRLAAALALFSAGSALRGFLFWEEFNHIHRGGGSHLWATTWPWFITSVYLNILGAAWCIWELSPDRYRVWLLPIILIAVVALPAWIYLSV